MKKFFRYIMAGLVAVMAASCVEEESFIQVDTDSFLAPVLNDFTPAITELTEAQAAETYATVQFTAADYGVASSINYTLYASVAGTDFAKEKQVGMPVTSPKTEIKVTVLDVNKVLTSLNCVPGTEVELDFRVKAEWMGEKVPVDGSSLYSNAVQASAVPYNMEKTYDPVWVIGDYCGWSHDNTLFLWNYKEDGKIYTGLIDFGKADADGNIVSAAKNGWKITGKAAWDDTCNWGEETKAKEADEPASIKLITGGGSQDIVRYAKRFYGFSFDKTSLELKKIVSFDQMGVIGLNGDWNNDIVMEYSKYKQRFYVDVEVPAETEFKFRADGKWDYNLGGDLEGLASGGGNITIGKGNYRIYLDMNNADVYTATISADAYGTQEGAAPVTPEPGPDQPSGKTVKMYFIPTADWMGENITFAVWSWATGGDGSWYAMSDSDADGVYETEIPEEYDNIIFTSMNGDTDWDNKVNQTADLKVPTDGMNAYDLATETWIEYVSPNVTVYFRPASTWEGEGITFAAWIWATDGNGAWYAMSDSDADGIYEVSFPKELDNIIFTSMNGDTDWDNKVNQTADLKVPADGNNAYDGATDTWMTLEDLKGSDAPSLPEGARTINILCVNPGWETANLYGWEAATSFSWPGIAATGTATLGEKEYFYWSLEAANWGKTPGLIFNNGSVQTVDITGTTLDGDKCFQLGEANAEGKLSYEAVDCPTIKVTYKNEAGWEAVSIYGWSAEEGVSFGFGDWPGAAMTKVGDVWEYEIPVEHLGKSVMLIFNNNGAGSQTVDLGSFVLDKDYVFDNTNAEIKQ